MLLGPSELVCRTMGRNVEMWLWGLLWSHLSSLCSSHFYLKQDDNFVSLPQIRVCLESQETLGFPTVLELLRPMENFFILI